MNFKRMKTLLLELAIHGKLVPQMTEEGQVKSSIDGPFELPNTWGWRKFEDVLFFENGDRGSNYPAKSTLTRDPSSGHPFVSAINLNNGRICSDDLLYLSVEQKQKLRSGHIKAGDCLFCIRGSLGKFGFAEADGGAIASSLVILRKKDAATIREEFLAYVLQSPFFAQCIEDRSNGTAQPNLGAKELKGFPFPVPPLQEQARIVAKLEESLAEIDRAEKAYQELQTLSSVLRGQILQEAIQGKLVPQLEEEGAVKSSVEGPFELPKSWGWQKFEDVLLFENGDRGANYPAKSTLTQDPISGHPFVSAINLKNGHIDKDGLLYLSTEQQKKLRSGHIKSGDCLFCIRGSLGKFGFAKTDGGAIASSLVILRRKAPTTLREKFLSYLLQSPFFDQCIKDRSNGTAQPNLGAKELKGFFFPLPPVQEQDRIVAKVEELLKQVDALSGQ